MVKRVQTVQRYAFTMIELIFAIVVISIAVISLPTITDATSRSIENGIIQEAVFAGSAELSAATSYYWDSRSMEDINVSHFSRVIDINGNCENNSSNPRYRLKPGHIAQPFHRRCLDSSATAVYNDTNTTDSLDSVEHTNSPIFEFYADADNNVSAGYKNSYNSIVDVAQDATNSNIKILTVTVSKNGNNIVKLKTQSVNIGEVDYLKRRF